MKHLYRSWGAALATGLMLSSPAQAQTHFSIGPSLGLNVSTAPFSHHTYTYRTTASVGVEAGVLAILSRRHAGLQAALLLSQKGFGIDDENHSDDGRGSVSDSYVKARYRLNYLTLPLNLMYFLRADGQGLQVFGGGYLGLLLGGDYDYKYSFSSHFPGGANGNGGATSGAVIPGDYFPNNSNIYGYSANNFYSRYFDAGLQGGLGYRFGRALAQVSYSWGLRNLAADVQYGGPNRTISSSGVVYRNRAVQASFSYLLFPLR
ncbi:MAG: hypothetical protein JWP58_3056 [Hymenobacter sp.]|nr:hypothetical protein [Hymenobacter sp.]